MKILIVEDETNSRVLLERALSSQGYAVESVANGAEALKRAAEAPPDMFISDIMMPGLDGFELCRRVKKDPRLAEIPFVFYTATYVEQEDRKLALALGAARFLVKPMEPDAFLTVIREVFQEEAAGRPEASSPPSADEAGLARLQAKTYSRKLDKKVRELEAERRDLRRTKVLLDQTQRIARVGGWEYDAAGRDMIWTEEVYRIYGVSPESYDPKDIARNVSFFEDPALVQGAFDRAIGSGKEFDLESGFMNALGEKFWVRVIGRPESAGGRVIRVSGVLMDISYRKLAEEALILRNAILSAQSDVAIDGILVVDERRLILSFNQRFVEMWGIPPDLIKTRDGAGVLRFESLKTMDPQRFLERVRYLYAHPEEKSREDIVLKDGRVFERYSMPMKATNGKYLGRVWYFHDISERKNTEGDPDR